MLDHNDLWQWNNLSECIITFIKTAAQHYYYRHLTAAGSSAPACWQRYNNSGVEYAFFSVMHWRTMHSSASCIVEYIDGFWFQCIGLPLPKGFIVMFWVLIHKQHVHTCTRSHDGPSYWCFSMLWYAHAACLPQFIHFSDIVKWSP